MCSIDPRGQGPAAASWRVLNRRTLPMAAALVLLLSAHSVGMVQAQGPRAATDPELLKAAFVYNFAKFTRWPEGTWLRPSGSFRLCTLGQDDLVGQLARLGGELVGGRPVEVRAVDLPLAERACHLLYLAVSAEGGPRELLDGINGKPVLTVSQSPRFARAGGMVELYRDEDRLRFRINVEAARAAGLHLSARLLDLAQVVYGEGVE